MLASAAFSVVAEDSTFTLCQCSVCLWLEPESQAACHWLPVRDNKRFVSHTLFSRWSHRGSGTRGCIICFHPIAEKSESGAGAGDVGAGARYPIR